MFLTMGLIRQPVMLIVACPKDQFPDLDLLFLLYVNDMAYCSRILQFVLICK